MFRKISILTAALSTAIAAMGSDSIPDGFSLPLSWRVGAEAGIGAVLRSNSFLRGENPEGKAFGACLSPAVKADFTFDPLSRQGMLYTGLYTGIAASVEAFIANSQLGSPASIYVYQGAPVASVCPKVWIGYEWQFGAAMGWKHYNEETAPDNTVASTSVTAHMGIAFTINYRLAPRWTLTAAVQARHFSNGNTSWPNAGANTLGVAIGAAYSLSPAASDPETKLAAKPSWRRDWFFDITLAGAWRKRIVEVGNLDEPTVCPGKFGVVALQGAAMKPLCPWVAVGAALDMQWDEGADLARHWVEGTYSDDIKFERPAFGRQLSAGISAHAELTTPIFSVNTGLGYDFVNPHGNKAFYQSLTLKTFVTSRLFINVGYRLGSFSEPQNLLLGLGVRL